MIEFESALTLLVTYVVHSTLFLLLAWLATATVLRRRPHLSEAIWRVAMVGGLVTTLLHSSGATPLISSSWKLASTAPPPPVPAMIEAATPAVITPTNSPTMTPFPWRETLVGTIAILSLLTLSYFTASYWALRRRIGRRELVEDPTILRALRDLESEAGLRRPLTLTRTNTVASPIALGTWPRHREIVIPEGLEDELDHESLRGVLAHEVAHHRWRDPLWRLIDRCVIAVAFFQPLHRLAARRLVELAEFRCDAWAVEKTGSPESFATGLATVAAWLSGRSTRPAPASIAAMAVGPSTLARRIHQVLDHSPTARSRLRPIALASSLLLAPAVAPAMPHFDFGATPPPIESAATMPPGASELEVQLRWMDAELRSIDHDLSSLPRLTVPSGAPSIEAKLERLRTRLQNERDALARRRIELVTRAATLRETSASPSTGRREPSSRTRR